MSAQTAPSDARSSTERHSERTIDAERAGGNDFPKLGINAQALIDHVDALIIEAGEIKEEMGAVNWGDIGVVDIEYRLSMLYPQNGPQCVVTVQEASPTCRMERWLNDRLDKDQFPNTIVECEW